MDALAGNEASGLVICRSYHGGSERRGRPTPRTPHIVIVFVWDAHARIMTDPGVFTAGLDEVWDLDLILITHQHPDHCDVASLKTVLGNSPQARVVTNRGVGALLDDEAISYETVEEGQRTTVRGVAIEAIGNEHAFTYAGAPRVQNTGYRIGGRLFHPGDALTVPPEPVEVLALPLGAPWATIGQSLEYALALMPKVAIPIHDGMLKIYGPFHAAPAEVLPPHQIRFVPLTPGDTTDV